jgi:transcriptional antiterminator RfaH
MQCSTNAPWVALHVRAKTEKTVAQHLQYRKYEHFLPLRDGAPLFDGYVFCRFDTAAAAPIVTTPGVIRIVNFGAVPARVDEHEIAAIRQALASGQTVMRLTSFVPGEVVSIDAGPLRGLRGTVLRAANRQFLVLSITLLQRSMAVEVHHDWLRPERPGHLPCYAADAARWPGCSAT